MIGDHTDQQVLTTRPNGVLVTENRSKGLRFTRVRLVIGPGKQGVVYKTADFHKPWDIGVTPDAAIQAKIDDLNAQLAPILSTKVGKSTVVDPAGRRLRRGTGGPTAGPASRSSATSSRTRCGQQYATDFAITNSGGLRADLTCPAARQTRTGRLLPVDALSVRTRRQVPDHARPGARVLPFGNVSATLTMNGAELKELPRDGRLAAAGHRERAASGRCRASASRSTSRRRPSSSTQPERASRAPAAGSRASCGRAPAARVTSPPERRCRSMRAPRTR